MRQSLDARNERVDRTGVIVQKYLPPPRAVSIENEILPNSALLSALSSLSRRRRRRLCILLSSYGIENINRERKNMPPL